MAKDPIKDRVLYKSLRDDGASQERAARIANAAAKEGRSTIGRRGGNAKDLDDRTVAELRERARELDITGVSRLRKQELIERIRNH